MQQRQTQSEVLDRPARRARSEPEHETKKTGFLPPIQPVAREATSRRSAFPSKEGTDSGLSKHGPRQPLQDYRRPWGKGARPSSTFSQPQELEQVSAKVARPRYQQRVPRYGTFASRTLDPFDPIPPKQTGTELFPSAPGTRLKPVPATSIASDHRHSRPPLYVSAPPSLIFYQHIVYLLLKIFLFTPLVYLSLISMVSITFWYIHYARTRKP